MTTSAAERVPGHAGTWLREQESQGVVPLQVPSVRCVPTKIQERKSKERKKERGQSERLTNRIHTHNALYFTFI